MRFYTEHHQYYCGIDLHAKTMYVCVIDADGKTLLHRNMRNDADYFLKLIAPYRDGLAVAVECIYNWYWLADLCADEKITFVLGHALAMRAIHGGKVKNDRVDSEKIAQLLRGGLLPQAYAYPKAMRAMRDLMRRRSRFVRQRAELLMHIQLVNHQYNLEPLVKRLSYAANRDGLENHFTEPMVQKSVTANLAVIKKLDDVIGELELALSRQATIHDPDAYRILQTIPGVGQILALTILYEVETIGRFKRVQEFLSYARLVKCAHESAGKRKGFGGAKMGNAHLKWAFSEAAVLFAAKNEDGKKLLEKLERKHGKPKAYGLIASKIGRAAYHMLKNKESFDVVRFFQR